MSPYAKRIVIILLVITAAVFAASFALRKDWSPVDTDILLEAPSTEIINPAIQSVQSRIKTPNFPPAARTSTRREVTTGVRTLPMATPSVLPPLTGYALDHFDHWTSIPSGYSADGLTIVNGAVTLATSPGSTTSLNGILVSPPLPLKRPSMSAPADSPVTPDGTDIILEVSLSEDGTEWSPWAVAQRYAPPDGKRVQPPLQARLSPADIAARDDRRTTSLPPGPAIRYRLTLSSTGSASPAVADLRIWKQEYQ